MGAAEMIVDYLREEIRRLGSASFVLSGGVTPRIVYDMLASPSLVSRVDWARVHLFWGDERCVPPNAPESNFRMVEESLLGNLSLPARNIHRIHAEHPPLTAAAEYESEIRAHFGLRPHELPEFSVVLLGLGTDGHTASLFPGSNAVAEKTRLVIGVYIEALQTSRVTMTLPVINNARTILFLVSGREKAGILREVLEDDTPQYPAQLVQPLSGRLFWCVDADAAVVVLKGGKE
jgi:6-phosphogluconolactonase